MIYAEEILPEYGVISCKKDEYYCRLIFDNKLNLVYYGMSDVNSMIVFVQNKINLDNKILTNSSVHDFKNVLITVTLSPIQIQPSYLSSGCGLRIMRNDKLIDNILEMPNKHIVAKDNSEYVEIKTFRIKPPNILTSSELKEDIEKRIIEILKLDVKNSTSIP